MLPFDALTVKIAFILGYKHILYLKGGRALYDYQNSSLAYKGRFVKMMNRCHLVFSEGEAHVELINKVAKTNCVYLPNFTEEGFAPVKYPTKPKGCINCIYFGRLSEEKNIELIIDIFNNICEKHLNVYLTIVGTGTPEYLKKIGAAIKSSKFKEHITRTEHSSHDKLKEILKEQHFFIFPSIEHNEGHSNALTEAMAYGIVPIVSCNNFLPSIVGDEKLVANDFCAETYSCIIKSIIKEGSFQHYSYKMYNRAKNKFSQSVIEQKIHTEINFNTNKLCKQ